MPTKQEAQRRRRAHLALLTPAEHAIRNAMIAVEDAGCDPLLTDAVSLLQQARDKVGDYVDRHDIAFYCPEHQYNPPPNSGFAFCPKCEITVMETK